MFFFCFVRVWFRIFILNLQVGPLQWLSPQTDDAIKGYASKGKSAIILVPISFVNEHIETLHELDIEYGKELALKVRF